MTSVKTLSQAASASSNCRLTYLKLKAFASESVSFASDRVCIPCELFPYGPGGPGCPQWPWCILHLLCLDREPKGPRGPLVSLGPGGQGHAMTPLQDLAVLSLLHELCCCQYKRWNTLHAEAKCAQGCLHVPAWHRPSSAGLAAGGSAASWPGIYCCLSD